RAGAARTESRSRVVRLVDERGRPAAPRGRRRRRLAGKPELAGDRAQGGDDVPDVVVELDPELLGALVDVLAMHAGGERRLLQLLPHRLRREPVEPRRSHERTRVHEAGELVAGEERL